MVTLAVFYLSSTRTVLVMVKKIIRVVPLLFLPSLPF